MKEKRKRPEMRIKGYADDWEQRKFADVYDFLQNNSLSRADLNEEGGALQSVHYGDVLVKYGEVLDATVDAIPYVNDESVLKKYQNGLLQEGDIIIADAAEDNTVGKAAEISGLGNKKVLSGLHTIPCRPKQKFASGYLGYYMNSRTYHDQLLPLIQGTKVSSISKSVIQDTDILYPSSADEQQKIGTYFRNLDHLITLHQREYERLICKKKGLLDKMFPRDVKNISELRFSEFSEPWVLKMFSEIFVERHIVDTVSEEYPQLSFTIEEGVIRPEDRKTNKRDFLILDKENKKYLQTEYDDIIYNPANVIYGAIHRNALGKGCVSPIYKIFSTDQDSVFMECIVRHPRFINEISRSMEGTVKKLKTLKPKAFLEMSAYIAPSLEEQVKIGQLFQKLDHLIDIEKIEKEKTEHIKSACLDKMFV